MTGYQGTVESLDTKSGSMVFEPILEKGVFRFDCSNDDRNAAFPSVSFVNPRDRETPISRIHESPVYKPTFEIVNGQQIVSIELPIGTSFYGTGEVSGQLERTGKRVFTWNTDAWGYGSGTTSLYQSHPWVLAVLPNGNALGVLADTTRRCEIDLRQESNVKFIAEPSYPVITFGPFDSPTDVLISLSQAVGTVFMPPKWSLGYHQCRWSYDSEARVREIARTFREKNIPCDVIWMDIDYMDGFRCFTFDKERFPNPQNLAKDLNEAGIKAIWMLDPGIKKEEGYFVYDSGSENDIWVQAVDGKPFVGEVWPGPCVFPDYTQLKARSWWSNLVKDFISNGVDGIWNDMNEPAVFKSVTKTMPENNIHRGDDELGGCQSHSHYHNVYGMLMARSTNEGMKSANENRRPFVLTRAGFVGSQRYAATWTGDNLSTWEHLHMSISMVLQLGLSGQPLSGPDIGGFAGNASPKLFARWLGIGSMFPFCRGHSEADTNDHEPWSFGEECEEVCRLALQRRYRFLPHIYTLFYLSHTKGTPVATPTFFADPKDPKLRLQEDSFMLGPVLVYASTQRNQKPDLTQHILPSGIWLNFDFEDSHPDLPTLYLRGGSIIPLGPVCQHAGESNPTDDLTLLVALDEQGKAEGVLFEDDGDGYEYTRGGYLLTTYIAELQSSSSSVLTVKVLKTEGSLKRPKRRLHVHVLLGQFAIVDGWGTDGETLQMTMPPEEDVSNLKLSSEKNYKKRMENSKVVPDIDSVPGHKGVELSRMPVVLKSGDWALKIVPWIGGRIISMEHVPSGIQWLHSRVEINGYEEYGGTEYRSAGCTEEYAVIERDMEQAGESEGLKLEGDIGGGLVIQREIILPNDNQKILRIDSGIFARKVGAGSGGFSRLVCLRVHPTFDLLHPSESYVSFTSIDGSKHEFWPQSGEQVLEADLLPNEVACLAVVIGTTLRAPQWHSTSKKSDVSSTLDFAEVWLEKRYVGSRHTSEWFNTAGRNVKTGLIASVIVSQWTWAATILQSSNVAWQYGISGPFWYASGATIQVLLFGVMAIEIKRKAPNAHTVCEIVKARWGTVAHLVFLTFCFMTNIIVTAMLLLGGSAVVNALTGVNIYAASFLIPLGVIVYTLAGGLKATFLASYIHSVIVHVVLVIFVYLVYVSSSELGSPSVVYKRLLEVSSRSRSCQEPLSHLGQSCGPVSGNYKGSYVTMLSSGGLVFGIINIVGNFGTVFVDNGYWVSAIAARPSSTHKGYLLGGLVWFAVPFSLATSLGLGALSLDLPITASEASRGLVPPATAIALMGKGGSVLLLTMLFMAVTSAGSSELIAVSSLCTYDIYRTYINPQANGKQILKVSRSVVLGFGCFMGILAVILNKAGVSLGWMYLAMGVFIGSAVIPIAFMLLWRKANAFGAILGATIGCLFGIITWLTVTKIEYGRVSLDTTGRNAPMLAGNLVSILTGGAVHAVCSVVRPQNYEWDTTKKITMVEKEKSSLDEEEFKEAKLIRAKMWIIKWGVGFTLVIVVLWPLLTLPAGQFSKGYFTFWAAIAIAWGTVGSAVIIVLPIVESWKTIQSVLIGMFTNDRLMNKISELNTKMEIIISALPEAQRLYLLGKDKPNKDDAHTLLEGQIQPA